MTVGQPRTTGRRRRLTAALALLTGAGVLGVLLGAGSVRVAAQDPVPEGQAPAGQSPSQDDAGGEEPQRPTFRLEANYVRVDAYPTLDGAPVEGLDASDFEILEDGKPQQIEQFERVELRHMTAREERRDPVSVADAVEQAGDPRRRVFIIYLDTNHTTYAGSHAARKPLVDMLERLIGPDDLFAVITPRMAARDIVFARRTGLLDEALYSNWTWGQRDAWMRTDPEEQQLEMCYPEKVARVTTTERGAPTLESATRGNGSLAEQLIRRKREQEVIVSLESLIGYLGVVREERKAVIMVTQGWELYRPKPELLAHSEDKPVPGPGGLGTGPDGRITTNRASAGTGNLRMLSPIECAALASQYARLDNFQRFTDMLESANRFNVSFYPFDTRGLAVSDSMMGDRSHGNLRSRLDSLRMIADNTDGLAVINTNDLKAGAQRIVNDLSSYYLLGYYSSNRDLDGKWRKITVRVKKPGVQVRARRGYRALRPEDMLVMDAGREAEASGGTGGAAADASAAAVTSAVDALAGARDGLPMYSRAAWLFQDQPGSGPDGRLWIAAEVAASALREPGWKGGATLQATVSKADGAPVAAVEVPVDLRTRTARLSVPLEDTTAGGELIVRLRVRGGEGTLPLSDQLRLTVPSEGAAAVGSPALERWGPSTGRVYMPAADPRFRRTERVRVALPVAAADATAATAELLDRTGAVLSAIPVKAELLEPDADGIRWAQADVTLAPLSAGDYVLRVSVAHGAGTSQVLTGIKVVQ